ncbi:MotA/TolQ/ExbB proton channel family protein [Myxococcota bacterium]|nr:MotA/TolQ/ExbB proton channel family protein [Myxococcota bacterium]
MSQGSPLVEWVMQSRLLEAEWVLYLLILLSIVSLAIVVERLVFLSRNRVDLPQLAAGIEKLVAGGDLQRFRDDVARMRGVEASVLDRALASSDRGAAAVEEVMLGVLSMERMRMERGLTFLGTVGSNAPFIGLFGTVLGIIRAFRDLSLTEQSQGASVVMAGISEALVATAVGLLVAIPAVVAYNYLQRRVKETVGNANSLGKLVLSRLR